MGIWENSLTDFATGFIIKPIYVKGIPMIEKIYVYESTGFDPYRNLATEKYLLDSVQPGQCVLYLWQNQNTVVIGRNQNAWAECRTTLLDAEGGHLARRLSGGGAVFHDTGNLNFTFLVPTEDYDVDRQLSVIQEACRLAGIRAEKSGRNDLLAGERKFSGNAFYHKGGHSYHHGTLMVEVDKDKLSRYLSPPKAKLEAKGVASVRSRVVNLSELSPGLTCQDMKALMVQAFQTVYGHTATPVVLSMAAQAQIRRTAALYDSWDYLYGAPLSFSFQCEERFPWGGVQLQLEAKGGVITAAKVYSDAMDWELAPKLEEALTGCAFRLDAMTRAVRSKLPAEAASDICSMLQKQDI